MLVVLYHFWPNLAISQFPVRFSSFNISLLYALSAVVR
jgi:hypothetical protein